MDTLLLNDWHPVARSTQVAIGALLAADLLETRVVLWRDSGGVLHAWEDRCPHRGTRLSMGALRDDTLHLGYRSGGVGDELQHEHREGAVE